MTHVASNESPACKPASVFSLSGPRKRKCCVFVFSRRMCVWGDAHVAFLADVCDVHAHVCVCVCDMTHVWYILVTWVTDWMEQPRMLLIARVSWIHVFVCVSWRTDTWGSSTRCRCCKTNKTSSVSSTGRCFAIVQVTTTHQNGRLKYSLSLLYNWSFSLFYIVSELWGSVGVSVLFWQMANDITPVWQANRSLPSNLLKWM